MNIKLIVILAVFVNCAICGVVENNRPKRTLHYFFEGLLSAFTEKHRSLSEENTDFLPFGLSKHKFMGLSSHGKSVAKPVEQVPIPSDKPKPTKNSLNSVASGPTKVILPLVSKTTTSTTPKPSTTPTNPSLTTTVTSTTLKSSSTTVSTTTTAMSTSQSSTSTTTTAPTSTTISSTSESTSTSTIASTDNSLETSSTDNEQSSTSETTLITSTLTTEPCDDTSNPSTAIDTTTPLSNEIQSKADTNITTTNTIGVQSLPLLPLRAPLLNTGRHTQFFGNPLIIQPHNSYLPSYYHEDDYENSVEPNTNTHASYRGAKYLPPIPNQLIVLPMAVPFQLPTASSAAAIDERSPRQSRTKMHDNDYNHYINHGTGQLQVPVVHLHQAHVQYFGRRSENV